MKLHKRIIISIISIILTGAIAYAFFARPMRAPQTNHERVIDSLNKVTTTLTQQLLKNEVVKDSFRNVVIKSEHRFDSLEKISLKNTAKYERELANQKKLNLKQLEDEAERVYTLYGGDDNHR